MKSDAATVDEYLDSLPPDRRDAIATVRDTVRANLPDGYEEAMNWGMITYQIPLDVYPDTYNGRPLMYAGLASQKNHMALYLSNVYGDPDLESSFREAYEAAGKKLDMGKSCVRFKRLDDLPLDVIGDTIAATSVDRMIDIAQQARRGRKRRT